MTTLAFFVMCMAGSVFFYTVFELAFYATRWTWRRWKGGNP